MSIVDLEHDLRNRLELKSRSVEVDVLGLISDKTQVRNITLGVIALEAKIGLE